MSCSQPPQILDFEFGGDSLSSGSKAKGMRSIRRAALWGFYPIESSRTLALEVDGQQLDLLFLGAVSQ
jgi:hypothetical protein